MRKRHISARDAVFAVHSRNADAEKRGEKSGDRVMWQGGRERGMREWRNTPADGHFGEEMIGWKSVLALDRMRKCDCIGGKMFA